MYLFITNKLYMPSEESQSDLFPSSLVGFHIQEFCLGMYGA